VHSILANTEEYIKYSFTYNNTFTIKTDGNMQANSSKSNYGLKNLHSSNLFDHVMSEYEIRGSINLQ